MTRLPLWANLFLLTAAVTAGAVSARRFVSRHPDAEVATLHTRTHRFHMLTGILAAALAVVMTLYVRPTLTWHLPLWLEYRVGTILWGLIAGIIVYVFAFAGTLMWRTGHPETRSLLVAAGLLVVALEVGHWRYTRPAAPYLTHKTALSGAILQTSDVSCCAAAAANILRGYGMAVTEREMAERFGTGRHTGTGVAQVVYGLRGMGIPRQKVTADRISAVQPPAILFVDHERVGPESHAVAYIRRDGTGFWVIDPLTGPERMSAARLSSIWHGKAVEVRAPGSE